MRYRLKEPLVRAIVGDHHFPDPCGITFRADGFSDLLEKITAYRCQNGLPLGDPEQEVLTFYSKHFPWSVIEQEVGESLSQKRSSISDNPDTNPANLSQSGTTPADSRPKKVDSTRLYAWVNQVWRNPPAKLLTLDEAAPRVKICLSCPYHQKRVENTTPAGIEASRRVAVLTKCRPASDALGVCGHYGWDCRLACLLPNPTREKGPTGCWVEGKKEPLPSLQT